MTDATESNSDVEHFFAGRTDASAIFVEFGQCIQVYRTSGINDGQLYGYVIFFAGGWDAWRYHPKFKSLVRAGCNLQTVEHALRELFDEGERCTGISANWCPIHGDCTCKDPGDKNDDNCPLHSPSSEHGELPEY